jgi:hypothetical protein
MVLNRPRQKQDGGVSPSTRVGTSLRCRSSASLCPMGPADQPEGWFASPVDGSVSCAEAHLTSLPGWTLPPFRRIALSSAGSASACRSAQMHLPMGSASQSQRTRELCPAAGSAARPRGTAWLYPERLDRTPAEAGAVSLLGRLASRLRRAATLPCGFQLRASEESRRFTRLGEGRVSLPTSMRPKPNSSVMGDRTSIPFLTVRRGTTERLGIGGGYHRP